MQSPSESTWTIKCRLCGNSDQNLVNLFEDNVPFPNLKLRICISLQIRISATDQLSHSICQPCYTKLEQLDRFIKQCQEYQFSLVNVDDTLVSPTQGQISTVDSECVPLCGNDLSSDFSDDLEENEYEVPLKKRAISHEFQDQCNETVLQEHEEIEIDLDDYEDRYFPDNSIKKTPPKNIPFSKLVSFFSSKVQVIKFDPTSGNSDLKPDHKIDPSVVPNNNVINPEVKIKCEEAEPETISDESDSQNDESETKYNEVEVKKETGTSHNNIKSENRTKTSKPKSSHLKSCPLCSHQFAPNELEDHVKFHSSDQEYMDFILAEMNEVRPKNKTHYCEECKQAFVRDSLFLEHQKEHLKIKMINCHLCDHTFSVRKKLKVHLRAVHVPKTSKCELCSYAAKTYPDLQKHIKGVHEFQPIICEICGKSVSCNVSNYNRHLQTHSEERPYKCELCATAYKTAASLQKHKSNIHFPKSVMCTACGTICGSQVKYKKHVRRCRKRMLRYS